MTRSRAHARSGADARIEEASSLGEASNTCAEGPGQGILPGASGWVTVTLPPGRYKLVCDLPGHYAASMYAQLTVS
ncbi:sulfocyanin-like copper-binding protein [Arthrobacter terricola]|uniref:sulfocyanin-like copper-binding protein n=2 Tax=Arthrobacter TaxID=1663 RepID=UPI001F313A01|nr:sulfocyanin-like copper-binding protein [Arthrobacter terricola]